MIEKKYIRLRKDVVAEYRRIVTPFFYVNLKPITYTYRCTRLKFLALPFGDGLPIPPEIQPLDKRWESPKGRVTDEKLEKKLDIENEKPKDNLIRLFV